MSVDLLYLCHGRLEFTKATLENLIARTNWRKVNKFVVYNDATPESDGRTSWWVRDTLQRFGFGELRETKLGSPVAVMNHFLHRSAAEIFAKIDNDIVVSNNWLDVMLFVMNDHPDLELLGAEPGMSGRKPLTVDDGASTLYSYVKCSHIGGVGLMRRSAFERLGYPIPDGRFGFTEWQHDNEPKRGWISPDLRLFALDLLPIEPWASLTKHYRKTPGLQRDWPLYKDASFYRWWTG